MPADLAIAPVSSLALTQKAAQAYGAKSPDTQNSSDASGQAPTSSPAASSPMLPNPSMSIDPGLGLVVMEFRDAAGKVTGTIPTQKQLDTYRQARLQDHTPGSDESGNGTASASGSSTATLGAPATTTAAKADTPGGAVPVPPVSQSASAGASEAKAPPTPASSLGSVSTLGSTSLSQPALA